MNDSSEEYLREREGNFMARIAELQAIIDELAARIAATKKVIEEGDERYLLPSQQCLHGVPGDRDCLGCYDYALMHALYPPKTDS